MKKQIFIGLTVFMLSVSVCLQIFAEPVHSDFAEEVGKSFVDAEITANYYTHDDYVCRSVSSSDDVILVNTKLITDKDGSEKPVIEKLVIQKGLINIRQSSSARTAKQREYMLEVFNQNNEEIFFMNFQYKRIMTVPPLPDDMDNTSEISQIKIQNPEVVLIIPYLPDASFIRIVCPGQNSCMTYAEIKDAEISDIISEREKTSRIPAQKGKFHILIMANGFSSYEMSSFNTKAQEIKNKLLSTEPFKSYSSNIDVHIYNNTSDLGCYSGCYNIDRLICCDGYDVTSAAATSGYYYDEIIVVHNTATYAGSGYRDYSSYQTNSYNSYTTVYKGDFSETMALHEFGHSFGDLCDEYSYGYENYTYYECVNCRTSCTDWSNLTTACTQGCDAKPSYYRPEDSVMLSLEIDKYNIVSIQRSLKPRLEYFITIAQQTGSLTVTVLPSTVATAGSQWQVDGGVWNSSGATVNNLTVGTHTISFKTVTGWTAPDNQNVTVTNGQTITATGTYIKIELPENVTSYKVFTEQSPEVTINYGEYVKVFGSSGGNTITVKSGGRAECVNFVGSNIVNIEDASSGFTVNRSGATVYLSNLAIGTRIKIPATKTLQTMIFNDITRTLVINNNQVMLGNQVVNLTPSPIL